MNHFLCKFTLWRKEKYSLTLLNVDNQVIKRIRLSCKLPTPCFPLTSQPALQFEEVKPGRDCVLECGPDKTCHTDTCCATKKDKNGMPIITMEDGTPVTEGIRQRTNVSAGLTPLWGGGLCP